MQSAHAPIAPVIAPPPWPGPVAPFAHPDRMGLYGALHGLATADIARARVLEIGCRDGANLLPLASAWPSATFVGLEADATLAHAAASRATTVGLANVTILAGPVAAFTRPDAPDLGAFDYVIAHGVMSRLPSEDRPALWTFVRRSLAPHGIGLVSFDTWPGQHMLEPLRRLMRYHIEGIPDPEERIRQARTIVRFHVRRWHEVHGPTRGVLHARLLAELDQMSDETLERELLTDQHHPLHLEDADAEARAHGLTWVANARASEPRLRWMPGSVRAFLAGVDDPVRQQQYMDFFVDNRFRTSLLCRDDAPLRRNAHVDEFMGFYVAPRLDHDPDVDPTTPGASTAPRLSREARWLLDEVVTGLMAPTRADEVVELAGQREFPGQRVEAQIALTELFFADAIELSRTPPPLLARPPEADTRPRATAYARFMATSDMGHATSLWQRDVALLPIERHVLARCDGATTADLIVEAAGPDGGDALDALHRHGFLLAPADPVRVRA